jgi:ubiquinone/menaquinone biosynthesis C-methylase UbiE
MPCRWVQGDALSLPFESGGFDAATMGYGLRNVADTPRAMRELHRVLKPGGLAAAPCAGKSAFGVCARRPIWVSLA